ncbi:hypothetical protein OHB39_18015 [Streptomyces sp. NBC_00047]|uniref:hypothetical protein n=1 Tax=Streptomyces sp. NBC_00047 TaxID=2975627 RepID=UPI002258217B|nr:hypothetical protein [Streptomyces sp. NBC_00047]MCX5609458.1 hypothetical protein [Streptomyces sp. NBC_00047]
MKRFWHRLWRVLKPVLEVAVAVAVLAVLIILPLLKGATPQIKNNLSGFAESPLANTGPLTGDLNAIPKEVACMKSYAADPANNMVNYPPVIGAPEHTDAIHSGVYPCATWTGDSKGPNQVFTYKSETNYPGGIVFVTFAGPNDAYLIGGTSGLEVYAPGPYVSKFNPSTGREIWRQPLLNININGQFNPAPSMAVGKDGLYAAFGAHVYRLDPTSGAILAHQEVPMLDGPQSDANFDGFHILPDPQGHILLKSQNRVPGCRTYGNYALASCPGSPNANPKTTMAVLDPVSLEVVNEIKLSQAVVARPIVTTWKDTIYTYIAGTETILRIRWDPQAKKLTEDTSWAPKYLLKGQGAGDAPAVVGKWIISNNNAAPSKTVPICAFAVSQDDPNDSSRLCPWGTTLPVRGASVSTSAAAFSTDPANNLFFMQDWLVPGIWAVHIDQATGDMKVKWQRDDITMGDYFAAIGPADQRVLLTQNLIDNTPAKAFAEDSNYQETLMWLDENTGKTLAQSTPHSATTTGSLINIGYGGRVYMMGTQGSLFIFQVAPCKGGVYIPKSIGGSTCPSTPSPSPSPSPPPSG